MSPFMPRSALWAFTPSRRQWLLAVLAAAQMGRPAHAVGDSGVRRGARLVFPADHGAHPDTRTEWWYATGQLRTPAAEVLGFQVTFFRSRAEVPVASQSTRARVGTTDAATPQVPPGRFAPRQLLFAHGALTDVAAQRQWHSQRLGRWNGDPAVRPDHATLTDTAVRLGGWSFLRRDAGDTTTATGPVLHTPGSVYQAHLGDADFGLDLSLSTTQPLLLQGEHGWSRKGPDAAHASHYYTQPQLAVAGLVQRQGVSTPVTGTAWLDHEWSDALMPPGAVGWDWVGVNLDSGAALTAFQLRSADGRAVWAGGSWRGQGQTAVQAFGPDELVWTPLAHWTSPHSGARYPVRWRVETPVGVFEVQALVNAQELDSRQSTGTVYWEGLSALLASPGGQQVGRGYLEMTGYAGQLRL